MTSAVTIVGHLTADPELRFTTSGDAVMNVTIARTPRFFDKRTEKYVDGETLFLRCTAWRGLAENIAETLGRGMEVIATGTLKQSNFEDKEGNKRSTVELDLAAIGPNLGHATAKVTKNAAKNTEPSHTGPSNAGQAPASVDNTAAAAPVAAQVAEPAAVAAVASANKF